MFRESGGTMVPAQGKYWSASIWTSGGNLGTGDGKNTNYARTRFIADANKVTLRLAGTTSAYRFIVDGQYVSLSGTVPSVTSGSIYLTLDFTSAGGRATREIAVEHTAGCGFVGVYVGPTEIVTQAPAAPLCSVALGDSYCYGSSATLLGDGIFAVMADYLGLNNHTNSGSGGTGWATGGSAYNFLQRIQNGDLSLGGAPDVIFLQGSVNDRNSAAADITANCLSGLRASRTLYPNAPIVVFGVWPANVASTGTLTVAANEAAVKAAFDAFADANSVWIPVNGNTPAWLVGTGYVGATTGTGDADINMSDVSHLNTTGTLSKGKMLAYALYAAVSKQGLLA
jgi:lysophospholipase L1-like esterase